MAMTKEQKDAMARGRQEARSIKAYLASLDEKRRGRPITRESLTGRLKRVEASIASEGDPLKKLSLLQTKLDMERAIASLREQETHEDLTSGFIAHAKSYSERKGISYTTWRTYGVPADVLRQAGIPETRRR